MADEPLGTCMRNAPPTIEVVAAKVTGRRNPGERDGSSLPIRDAVTLRAPAGQGGETPGLIESRDPAFRASTQQRWVGVQLFH